MRINQNVAALNAWRNLTANNTSLSKSLERLSSGLRVNRAADDAAGLAISEKMRSQIRGLQMAQRNAQDGISLIQTAEGALIETHAILQRMRELAVQAANDGTLTDQDKSKLQDEVTGLIDEINRIATDTEFNTQKLLNGSFTNKQLQVGANASQVILVSISTMSASALGATNKVSSVNISTVTGANRAISILDAAIEKVSEQRSKLGALQNRLEHTYNNLGVAAENLTAAESRIRDADMAREMSQFTRSQILLQASTAMLAHANMAPQSVLQLLS